MTQELARPQPVQYVRCSKPKGALFKVGRPVRIERNADTKPEFSSYPATVWQQYRCGKFSFEHEEMSDTWFQVIEVAPSPKAKSIKGELRNEH